MKCRLTLAVTIVLLSTRVWAADPGPLTSVPSSLAELKAFEKKIQAVTKKVQPAVVGLQIGGASGSGVIVTEDGVILTAGHVSGKPGQEATVILPDGKRIKGKTLGANRGIDSGMVQITTPGKWPFASVGESSSLEKGQWCISLGHPGGYHEKRTPVLRLGRILNSRDEFIQTDCTLVGGDSGGPLFDLNGKVIGIHSRIGPGINFNIHVPIATYTDTWDRLLASESWGGMLGSAQPRTTTPPANLGWSFEKIGETMRVIDVIKDSPADKAGIKPKDRLALVEGQTISNRDDIETILKKKKPGEEVSVEVLRGSERLKLKVMLAKAK